MEAVGLRLSSEKARSGCSEEVGSAVAGWDVRTPERRLLWLPSEEWSPEPRQEPWGPGSDVQAREQTLLAQGTDWTDLRFRKGQL